MPRRLEIGEDSVEIVDSFCYLGEDVISCWVGLESAGRSRKKWSKWMVEDMNLLGVEAEMSIRAVTRNTCYG